MDGITSDLFSQLQGLARIAMSFPHLAGTEQGKAQPSIVDSQTGFVLDRFGQFFIGQQQSGEPFKITAVIKYIGPFVEKIDQALFFFFRFPPDFD